MKRILLAVAMFITAIWSFAQSGKQSLIKDEDMLTAINHQFIKNFLHNDTVSHSRIIHPNFLFIGKDGSLHGRTEYMNGWLHGYDKAVMPEFDLVDEQIRLFGNTALIVAKTRDKTLKNGKWVTGETRYTDTYIKDKGEWKCVQVQLTRMPSPEN